MTRYLVPILTLKDNGGGAVALSFARSLRAQGMDVVVLSSGFHGEDAVGRPENEGLRFVISPAGWFGGRAMALALFFLYAVTYSVLHRPRVIYTHIATGVIPDLSGTKPVMLAQDLEYRFYSARGRQVAKWLFQRITSRARLIVSSLWLERFFRRRGLDVLFAADVGISKPFFGTAPDAPRRPRDIDFLLIAKRGHHKRHDETCAVAEALTEQGFHVTLIDQAPRDSGGGPSPRLRRLGAVSLVEMRELFREAKVFIGLSRAEGYGLTPLEALSQGCRVVTTPTPSTSSLCNDALAVVAGEQDMIERLVAAALEARAAAAAGEDQSMFGYRGPFMEDWSLAAVRALGGEAAR